MTSFSVGINLLLMKDTVQLHVDVSRSLWRAMKVAAMDRGDTLAGVVVKALEVGFDDVRVAQMAKQDSTKSGRNPEVAAKTTGSTPVTHSPLVNVVTPSGKYGKPIVDEDVVATVTCFKCKEKVFKWTMDPRGKPWCPECIQDQKNAIA